jgi:hypothetical protein
LLALALDLWPSLVERRRRGRAAPRGVTGHQWAIGDLGWLLAPVPDPLARASWLFDRRHSPLFGRLVLLSPIQNTSCPSAGLWFYEPFLYRKTSPPPHLLQHFEGNFSRLNARDPLRVALLLSSRQTGRLLGLGYLVDACLWGAFPQDQTNLAKNRQVSFQRPRSNLEPLAQLTGAQPAGAGQLVQDGSHPRDGWGGLGIR